MTRGEEEQGWFCSLAHQDTGITVGVDPTVKFTWQRPSQATSDNPWAIWRLPPHRRVSAAAPLGQGSRNNSAIRHRGDGIVRRRTTSDFYVTQAAPRSTSTALTGRPAEHAASRIPSTQKRGARAALSGEATAIAKDDRDRVGMIRSLRVARGSAMKGRTQIINQMQALLITAPIELRERLRGLTCDQFIDVTATDPALSLRRWLHRNSH